MAEVKHEFDAQVSARIKAYLKDNRIHFQKVADEAGMTYCQFYQMVNGLTRVKLQEYVGICKALDVEFGFFLEEA